MTGTGPTAAVMNMVLASTAPTIEKAIWCRLAKESVILCLLNLAAGPSDGHASSCAAAVPVSENGGNPPFSLKGDISGR